MPLRKSLFLRFALLVSSAMVLFTLGYVQFGVRPVVDRVAESQFSAASGKVHASLDRLFDPAEVWVGVACQWAMSTRFDEAWPEEFNRLFQPVLVQSPQLTSVVAGTSDGRGWMLLEKPGGAWMNRFTDIPGRGNEQVFIDWAADGSRRVRRERVDYDPRSRPWYTGAVSAMASRGVYWTDPYVFFTTGDLGITASTAVLMPDATRLALGMDIKLLDISRTTSQIVVGTHGYVLLLTVNGRLVGIPRSAGGPDERRFRDLALKPVSALGTPEIDAGFDRWQRLGRRDGVVRYASNGATWLTAFQKIQYGNQAFWVAVFAPEADFIPPWQPMAKALLGIFATVLLLSFLLARRYTRRFSDPLEALAANSARVAQLDFDEGSPVESDIEEIEQLAAAQKKMRGMLNEYRCTVDSQADSLKHQIVALRSAETRLEHLSQHDPLTGLPNRLLLADRLSIAVSRAERHGTRIAVLFLDLDRFKAVNDSQGHPVGDKLLCSVAGRLSSILRESDTVARLGGDEFVLLVEEIEGEQAAEGIARKLLEGLALPFDVDGHAFHLTGSVGISLYPDDGQDTVTLIRNADSAMYQAKAQGRNAFRFYSEEMTSRAVARMQLEESLHSAIRRGELELHYQPQVSMPDGQLVGAEALVRWRHPEKGLIPPDVFIPVAEETGLIGAIGEWVLEESSRQWAEWARRGMLLPRIAVNISVKQLQGHALAAQVKRVLDHDRLPASVLELEVTESFFLESPQALEMLLEIGRTGVSFALDDFGTGYSSLGYLKKLPLARLKIDRGFTRDIGRHSDGEAVVRVILGLADTLGREVIAEGVETREQAEFLQKHGCRQAQGYLYAKPMPAADFLEWWSRRCPTPEPPSSG